MKPGDLIEVTIRDRQFLAKITDLGSDSVGFQEIGGPWSTGHTQYHNVRRVHDLYGRLLSEYEKEPSNIVYELLPKEERIGDDPFGEGNYKMIQDERYKKYNLMGMVLDWQFEGTKKASFLSRKRKKRLCNRLNRFFRNQRRKL